MVSAVSSWGSRPGGGGPHDVATGLGGNGPPNLLLQQLGGWAQPDLAGGWQPTGSWLAAISTAGTDSTFPSSVPGYTMPRLIPVA